ncbi:MAG: 23S rRNA (adenine(2503)-C(2))-methyltransferase RlmN, partial [Candidatus Dormiibacterota bacterium]
MIPLTPHPAMPALPVGIPAPPLPALSTLGRADLERLLGELGEQPWRARQLGDAVWQPFVTSLADIHQLPAGLRDEIGRRLRFATTSLASEQPADQGRTVKLLCRLDDGQTVETVAMESPPRRAARRRATVCVSTQVGCAVGCPFCATGMMGLRRSCQPAEVVDQVRLAGQALHRHGLGPVTHVVYMGMGEPLLAYDTTVASIRVLTEDTGISPRRITVSTSGVVPGIDRLSREALPVTLAISLHAATEELRDRLVPLNRAHPLDRLITAATGYAQHTGRRLSLEWCLIGGMNDSQEQADGLARIARRLRAHVNVIPMNRIVGSPWGPPKPATARAFLRRLVDSGTVVTVRDTR